jgi:hypothetical protein
MLLGDVLRISPGPVQSSTTRSAAGWERLFREI